MSVASFQLVLKLEQLLRRLPACREIQQGYIAAEPAQAVADALETFASAESRYADAALELAEKFRSFRGKNLETTLETEPVALTAAVEDLNYLVNLFCKENA